MPPLRIRLLGDPVLRGVAAPLAEVTDETRRLIDDMMETMYAADGVGLAAPQVGIEQRVIVIDVQEEGVQPLALVNPEIVVSSTETERGEEGCLSIPGLRDVVERPARVVVTALGRDGAPQRIEADGLLARALQHEVDHLNGVLFIDRVSALKRRLLLSRWQKIKPAGQT